MTAYVRKGFDSVKIIIHLVRMPTPSF